MIDENPMRAVSNYGSSAAYKDPPDEDQIRKGVVPLDSLPAAWWNWMWNETNSSVNEARTALTSVIAELNNVLCCAGITPQSACMDQLYKAIVCLRQAAATEGTAGSVKSSNVCGKVSVGADGTMTANGLGNASNLSTSNKANVVSAINELKSTYDSCFTDVSGCLDTLENSKLDVNGCAADSAKLGGTAKSGLLTGVTFTNGRVGVTVGGTTCSVALGSAAACSTTAFLAANGCAADSAKLGGTAKSGLFTGLSYSNNKISATVGGTSKEITLGSAAACSTTAFLAANGCAADSAKLGGTAKSGLLTAFSCSNNQMSITVGGTTCTAAITVPNACFGTACNYTAFKCSATGEAGAAECRINLGYSRSYRWCQCTTNVCSYDRRTYTYVGTCQAQNACNGMTYIDTCVWQCCYSGTAGVISCTNRRWCFCSNGYMYTPGAVVAQSDTFGQMLVANRTGSANYASVTFCNCKGKLGHIGMNSVDGKLYRWNAAGNVCYAFYDSTSTDIPAESIIDYTCCDTTARVYVGFSGPSLNSSDVSYLAAYSTTLCNGKRVIKDLPKAEAQKFLGLRSAAYCDAGAFRSSAWTPTCVEQAGYAYCLYFNYGTMCCIARCIQDLGHGSYLWCFCGHYMYTCCDGGSLNFVRRSNCTTCGFSCIMYARLY